MNLEKSNLAENPQLGLLLSHLGAVDPAKCLHRRGPAVDVLPFKNNEPKIAFDPHTKD